jgi:tRNA-modifying protein YgfZ
MLDLLTNMSETVVADYDRLRDDCGLVELSHLGLVSLTGEDRKGWLQGQVTNNVRSLESGASSSFCFCEPTGHVLAICDSWALPDRIVLTTDRQCQPGLLKRVEQMVIMEDVVAESADQTYRLFSIQGPRATAELSRIAELPSLDAGIATVGEATVFILRSNRTGMGGWDIWVPADQNRAIQLVEQLSPKVSQAAYDVARLESGIPAFGTDITSRIMPPEMGPAFETKHISYHKGCYVGQEVLVRIHSRGHTNRTWVGLLSESPLEVGATVSHSRRADAGVVTSAGFSPDYGHIAAAMLRNEAVGDRENVSVTTSSGKVEAEVRPMPLLRFD